MTEEKHLAAHEIAKVFPPLNAEGQISLDEYKKQHAESIADVGAFWGKQATERLEWYAPFPQTLSGDLLAGDVTWFAGGKLNVCYNAVDRHVQSKPNQVAIVFEGDEPDDVRKITYMQLQRKVSQIANTLLMNGVARGDVVTVSCVPCVCFPTTLLLLLVVEVVGHGTRRSSLTRLRNLFRFTCP